MATKPDKPRDIESIKQVIHLLKRALDDCETLLAQAESDVRMAGQDNEPRIST